MSRVVEVTNVKGVEVVLNDSYVESEAGYSTAVPGGNGEIMPTVQPVVAPWPLPLQQTRCNGIALAFVAFNLYMFLLPQCGTQDHQVFVGSKA